MRILIVTLLVTILAWTQEPQQVSTACPITIEKVNNRFYVPRPSGLSDRYLSVKYKNTSGKDVKLVGFGVRFRMVDGEPTVIKKPGVGWVRPGESHVEKWQIDSYDDVNRQGVEVWVNYVIFSDRSVWDDGGEEKCKLDTRKK